jgi:hypothetical protein
VPDRSRNRRAARLTRLQPLVGWDKMMITEIHENKLCARSRSANAPATTAH